MHTLQQDTLVCLPAIFINAYTIPCLFRSLRIVNNLVPETVPQMMCYFRCLRHIACQCLGYMALTFRRWEKHLIGWHVWCLKYLHNVHWWLVTVGTPPTNLQPHETRSGSHRVKWNTASPNGYTIPGPTWWSLYLQISTHITVLGSWIISKHVSLIERQFSKWATKQSCISL